MMGLWIGFGLILGSASAETLNLSEVQKHSTAEDCWVVIDQKVYDVTAFIKEDAKHARALEGKCGKDVSQGWHTKSPMIQKEHSKKAQLQAKKYLVGQLDEAPVAEKPEPYHVPAIMRNFMVHLLHLQPYLGSQAEFGSEQNEEMIQEGIEELLASAKAVQQQKHLQVANYVIPMESITRQISGAYDDFKKDRKDVSRRQLLAVPAMCSHCHMQGGGYIREVFTAGPDDLKGSAMVKAEYLYATRNFDSALKQYDRALTEVAQGRSPDAAQLRDKIFYRRLSYWVRAKRDFAGGVQDLQRMSRVAGVTDAQKKRLQAWVQDLNALKTEWSPGKKEPKNDEVLAMSEKIFDAPSAELDSKLPRAFWLAGLLSDQLIHHSDASAKTAEVLYWSGRADQALAGHSVYSTARELFRDCAEKFKEHPISKKCQKALESI